MFQCCSWHKELVTDWRLSCTRQPYIPKAYDALSYTWGEEATPREIMIGNKELAIGKNLYQALRSLRNRQPDHTWVLWIDAICIDQKNVHERNHQVHMMRRIFSSASSVVVWLGDCDALSQKAIDLILEWNRNSRRLYSEMPPLFGPSAAGSVHKKLTEYPEETLQSLSRIFGRRWWKRIWIVQEVVAARELVVMCGKTLFQWQFLDSICIAIRLSEFTPTSQAQHLRRSLYRNFTALNDFRRHRGFMPLTRYLQCTRDYRATDPRDKLYALLGVATDLAPDEIMPDYTKPVDSVFSDLVMYLGTKHGNLDIVSCGHLSNKPSWMPDWRVVSHGLRALNNEEIGGDAYRAGGVNGAVMQMNEFPTSIIAEGVVVDKVDFFGGTVDLPAQQSLTTLRRWQYISAQNSSNSTADFWKTIVAGKDHLGRFASPDFGKAYESFLEGASSTSDPRVQYFADAVTRAVLGRRFFITRKGRIGLGPPEIQLGDRVVVLKGCSVPLILRIEGNHMVVVGESYVSGIMNGEVLDHLAGGRYKSRMVRLN